MRSSRIFELLTALVCASACSGKAIVDPTTGGGGSTTQTTSGSMSTTTSSQSVTSSMNTGPGGGNEPGCLSCADFLNSSNADPDELCQESLQLLVALATCVCADGVCATECPQACDTPGGDESGCMECVLMDCPGELQACLSDN